MEAILMKVVRRLSRSWTRDSYFSLRWPTVKLINGGHVRGKCPEEISW